MTVQTTSRVPVSRTGWPRLRTPRWMLAAAAVLVVGMALAAWPTHPSTAQRAADLRAMVHDLTVDIQSCAGGVNDSLTALRAIQDGSSTDVATAESIVSTAVNNCYPINNTQIQDLIEYEPPESLAAYHLRTAVEDMWTWATPLAQRVQNDAGVLMQAHGAGAVAAATATLRADQRALDAERTAIDKLFETASRALSANVTPPPLPS